MVSLNNRVKSFSYLSQADCMFQPPKRPKTKDSERGLKITDAEKLSSRFQDYRNDSNLTGYLDLVDVADLRRLRFSWPVIRWYLFFKTHCTGCTAGLGTKNALLHLDETGSVLDKYIGDEDTLIKNFPIVQATGKNSSALKQNAINLEQMFAAAIVNLCEDIAKAKTLTNPDNEALQKHWAVKFPELTSDKTNYPEFQWTDVVLPGLGPLIEYEETHLEKYNRAINILLLLQHALMPSRWKKRSLSNYYKSKTVTNADRPIWMKPAVSVRESLGATGVLTPQRLALELIPKPSPGLYAESMAKHDTE